ncbi:immunoglobulin E-set [Cantharellus anzutake]|uniref:immunoglobulin E-set n=1 Tax=Cantharellus anzutake TaxID=1750568 RepID=UPI001905AD6B|nr:immunoglobulin E-set [Cantharellus anzutake]KAF8324455.1 immunoglobulin E-set [Cantharellus anzutake]
MSTPREDDEDLKATFEQGYKPGEKKSIDEYAKLDSNDESLKRWKESLGIVPGATSSRSTGPKVTILTLELTSPTLPQGKKISFDLQDKATIDTLKKSPVLIKEGVEYSVGATFRINYDVISGLRYIQVVKKAGIKVEKLDQMIGSYGPHPGGENYKTTFYTEESPSGLIVRQGTYHVKSRFTDDDNQVHADFEWAFKLAKDWA